jgi:hypothetical protein
MAKRQNFQTVSWFHDIYKRKLLDLDPPYQRRSVWNQEYKDYFIDTILLEYPSPAIFLFEEIDPSGITEYKVVDGKQRLTTIFEFLEDKFPVSEIAQMSLHRGKYFKDLDPEIKKKFWGYDFLVEYLPSNDENIINDIFNRINKNVAKLTPQELRHARFDGEFIKAAEELASRLEVAMPSAFPRIGSSSRMKMKDVELVADLLLLIEVGPEGYSQTELDEEFSMRESEWIEKEFVLANFDLTLNFIKALLAHPDGQFLVTSRFRNQNDFYSLFGALSELIKEGTTLDIINLLKNLSMFIVFIDSEDLREKNPFARKYWENVRTAPNQTIPRKERIEIIKMVISGDFFKDSNDSSSSAN